MDSNLIKSERILSLDVFRGLTMAAMVVVNALGTRISYPILEHADWNGCTLADLVFPSFLFIVGMTTVISLKNHVKKESKAQLYYTIFRRAILLFLCGLFINAFPSHFDFTVRVYGILQRIAVCYLVCAFLYLHTSVKTQIFVYLAIILGYWYFLTQIPMPTRGSLDDQLGMARNWVGYIDTMLFSRVQLLGQFDPEGLLSTIPAIATTIAGLVAGSFLLTEVNKKKKCLTLIGIGLSFLLFAWIWSYSFPINKKLWTSTFVLWAGGFSLTVFGICYFIIDILGYTKWSLPFKIFGMNALFIFIFHVILLKIQSMFIVIMPDGTQDYLRAGIAAYLFGYFSPQNTGLFYSLLFLVLNFLVATFLYRRKIFFKL